jgi:putative endonuclease
LCYVYLIESLSAGCQRYVGMTDDLRKRLREHNAEESSYTAKFRPWKLTTYIAFTDPAKAAAFERYLKSGSGHALRVSGCGSHVALYAFACAVLSLVNVSITCNSWRSLALLRCGRTPRKFSLG